MKKNIFKITILSLLVLNLLFMTILYAESVWITKINDTKISLNDFNDSYKAVVIFGAMNSPVPITDSQIKELLKDKDRRKLFLRSYEDNHLVVKVAKEKNVFNETEIDETVKSISKLLKTQFIIKEFYMKFILPKVSVTSDEISTVYDREKDKKRFKGIPASKLKEMINTQLKYQKAQIKLKDYTEKLRLESEIVHNRNVIED
ncbi:MAG: hypothetical protein OEV44_06350 [Spirochaetota bacterium]|nr:hypothetical protein [Spirochaetota bacterium]